MKPLLSTIPSIGKPRHGAGAMTHAYVPSHGGAIAGQHLLPVKTNAPDTAKPRALIWCAWIRATALVMVVAPTLAAGVRQKLEILPCESSWKYSGTLSCDGRLWARPGSGTQINIWEWRKDIIVRQLNGGLEARCLEFHPKFLLLAAGTQEGKIQLWNPSNGLLQHTLTNSESLYIRDLQFSEDGQRLVALAGNDRIFVWETAQWTLRQELRGNSNRLALLNVNNDGSLIAAMDETLARRNKDGSLFYDEEDDTISGNCVHTGFELYVWNSASGQTVLRTNHIRPNVGALALHPHKPLLAAGYEEGFTAIVSLETGETLQRLDCYSGTPLSVFWADQQEIAAVCYHKGRGDARSTETNYLWNFHTGELNKVSEWKASMGYQDQLIRRHRLFSTYNGLVTFNGDSLWVPRRLGYSTSSFWESDGRAWARSHVFGSGGGTVPYLVRYRSDGKRLLALFPEYSRAFEVDTRDWNVTRIEKLPESDLPKSYWILPTLEVQYGEHAGSAFRVRDLQTGRVLKEADEIKGPEELDDTGSVWFSSDHRFLAGRNYFACNALSVLAFEGYLRPLHEIGLTEKVGTATFSDDSTKLMFTARSNRIQRFDMRELQSRPDLATDSKIQMIDFNPTGELIGATTWDDHAKRTEFYLWNWATGQLLLRRPIAVLINCFRIASDGRLVALGCDDFKIRLIDGTTGTPVRELNTGSWIAYDITFSPDGRKLSCLTYPEFTVQQWDITTGELDAVLHIMGNGEWISHQPGKAVYNSSEHGDEWASLRIGEGSDQVYPLHYYRKTLRRTENLSAAFTEPSPEVRPKPIRFWYERMKESGMLAKIGY